MFKLIENYLIFYPESELITTPEEEGFAFEDAFFSASDGVELHGWIIPGQRDDQPVAYVMFLHGNAGNISHFLEKILPLVKRGVTVFAFDYRGFGFSQGRPSEKGTYLDAEAAFEFFLERAGISPEELIVFGYSLGGAVAVDLAVHHPVRGLIVESSFTSIRDMAKKRVSVLPRFLVSPCYETLGKVPGLQCPALFIHGMNDDLVPVVMTRRLYQAHPGPKDLLLVPRAGHIDTHQVGGEKYWERLMGFIQNPEESSGDLLARNR